MQIIRRVAVIGALIAAWALAGNDRVPLTLSTRSEAIAATSRGDDSSSGSGKGTHDLSQLRILTKVMLYVKDNYVDPKRVKPKDMVVAALEAVEKSVPEVLVDGSADSGKVSVVANGKTKEFDISHIDSMWKMSFTLKEIFDFISKNMRPMEDTRDVEYAAVNGMLQTLDPHSILMRPEMYREMKMTTKGEFGGLGFVIQMKEGVLTVVKVLPKTPAFRAGIKKDDQIVRIGEESTVNMDLNEAVGKLRGPVDSTVTITVNRKSWEKPQTMNVTRALINLDSVMSKLLSSNVGYVRLKNFQGNTTRDLQAALDSLEDEIKKGGGQGMKGLVLDLRGNPGGLLEQAIQVSDTFVSSGTIVSTVGLSDKLREEKKAHADEGDELYPIAVLINAGSASASEIVAGALKNLNRAVIIGRQSFGKGSVQVLYDFPDDSALKLTIAKYLTPGDISIQEIGITPDIQLIPTRVSKERIEVWAPRRSMGEADLDHHFGNPSNATAAKKREDVVVREKPSETVKYLKIEKEKEKDKVSAKDEKKPDEKDPKTAAKAPAKGGKNILTDTEAPVDEELDDQLDAEAQDEIREDFEISFARDFVLAAPSTKRDKMIEISKSFVAGRRTQEESRINSAITGLGIDWAPGTSPKAAQLVSTLKPAADKPIVPGEPLTLELTVENKGGEAVHRLRGWTESENGYLDRREFIFGALNPGEKKSWPVTIKLPKDLTSRKDGITVKLQDDSAILSENATAELNFVEIVRPKFAFDYAIVDSCATCNGDGIIQRGETVNVMVDVTNVGTGKAPDTFASIKNESDQNIFIEKGRFKLGEIPPGETRSAKFVLQVKQAYSKESFDLRLAVLDEPLEEYTTDKINISVAAEGQQGLSFAASKPTTVKVADKADLLSTSNAAGPILGKLPKGALLTELGRSGDIVKLEWDKERFVFAKAADVKDAKGQKPTPVKDLDFVHLRTPAVIAMNVDSSQGGIVVDAEKFNLSATVTDPKLIDAFVLVNDQKVFFKARSGDEPMKIVSEFALKEGTNVVTILARQSQDFATRKTVVIRRRPSALAQKTVPAPAQAKP